MAILLLVFRVFRLTGGRSAVCPHTKGCQKLINQFGILRVAPVLQSAEIGIALLVKGNDLAVQYGVNFPAFQYLIDRTKLVERQIITGDQVCLAVIYNRHCTVTIPFDLINPAGVVERRIHQSGFHGLDIGGHL